MTVDYYKLSQVITMIAAAVPNVVSLLKQINTFAGYLVCSYSFVNAFSIAIHQKQFAFSWKDQQYTFTVLPQGCINSLVLCYNLVGRDLDHLFLSQGIPLVHYTDDVMLVGPNEQTLATSLDLLVKNLDPEDGN